MPYAPCPYVIHMLDRQHDPKVSDWWKASAEALLRRAEEMNFVLALETAPYKIQLCQRYPDSAEIAAFVRDLDSPHMRACIDLNHSNLHENLTRVAANFDGLIANIHISDNHGITEDHLPPGEGGIDFVSALQAIINAGYRGPLNLECHTPGYPSHDELVALRLWCEEMITKLTIPE